MAPIPLSIAPTSFDLKLEGWWQRAGGGTPREERVHVWQEVPRGRGCPDLDRKRGLDLEPFATFRGLHNRFLKDLYYRPKIENGLIVLLLELVSY